VDGGKIADAFRDAIYAEEQEKSYFGIPLSEFCHLFSAASSDLVWAPGGDEAFDDGSYVLQFDVGERIRIVAFKCKEGHYHHDPDSLREVWLGAPEFYGVLQNWRDAFRAEWAALPKADVVGPTGPGDT
jgi:hypothetical protein